MTEARREIRSMIYGKFDTEKDCADAMGWPRQRLNKITTGKKEPSVSEVVALAHAVDRSVEYVANIFLRMASPNG